MCIYDFKCLKYSLKELCYPFAQLCVYLICGIRFKAILGGIVYILISLIITCALLPETMNKIANMLKQRLTSFF